MTTKNYAIIQNDVVVNLIVLSEEDCATEDAGNTFVQSMGFAEGKDAERPESPTPARIGDQFNRELGRFQDDPDLVLIPIPRFINENDPSQGIEDDPTKEWFYNDDGRWEVRDVQEGA